MKKMRVKHGTSMSESDGKLRIKLNVLNIKQPNIDGNDKLKEKLSNLNEMEMRLMNPDDVKNKRMIEMERTRKLDFEFLNDKKEINMDKNEVNCIKLSENAELDSILDVIPCDSVIVDNKIIEDSIKAITQRHKLTGMADVLDKFVSYLKCPECNLSLKRGQGRPHEALVCSKCGKMEVFEFAAQFPKRIRKEYLEKAGKQKQKQWIAKLNNIIDSRPKEDNLFEEQKMEICGSTEGKDESVFSQDLIPQRQTDLKEFFEGGEKTLLEKEESRPKSLEETEFNIDGNFLNALHKIIDFSRLIDPEMNLFELKPYLKLFSDKQQEVMVLITLRRCIDEAKINMEKQKEKKIENIKPKKMQKKFKKLWKKKPQKKVF